jgi:hypothetical protein
MNNGYGSGGGNIYMDMGSVVNASTVSAMNLTLASGQGGKLTFQDGTVMTSTNTFNNDFIKNANSPQSPAATFYVSSGTVAGQLTAYQVTASTVTATGPFQLGSLSSPQTTAPAQAGQVYYCSSCSNALTCISTGTVTGAWASMQATNRHTACN